MRWLSVCLLAFSLTAVGCGGGIRRESVTPPPPPPAKALLEGVAQSGELGSGAETIRQALETLKATDATKAEDLLKDLAALEKTTGAANIKTKAKAMADKL